jgi:hypothetical protein
VLMPHREPSRPPAASNFFAESSPAGAVRGLTATADLAETQLTADSDGVAAGTIVLVAGYLCRDRIRVFDREQEVEVAAALLGLGDCAPGRDGDTKRAFLEMPANPTCRGHGANDANDPLRKFQPIEPLPGTHAPQARCTLAAPLCRNLGC